MAPDPVRNAAPLVLSRRVRLILEGLKAGFGLHGGKVAGRDRIARAAAGLVLPALLLPGLLLSGGPAAAALSNLTLSDLTLASPSFPVGDAQLTINGQASGALFGPDQPGLAGKTIGGTGTSGTLRLSPSLRRDYDSGLALSLEGTVAASDPLSRGRYDGDALERLAGVARTGLGTVEIGLTDGAGYDLAVMGPRVDPNVALDDGRTSFFRDPRTGRALSDLFALRTQVGASSNYAKFTYASPEVFGVQLGLSFTPSQGKQLPFLNAGPHMAGRAADIWEAALKVEQGFGPVSLSAYLATAQGRAEHTLPGQHGVNDTGFGVKADYNLNDTLTLSLGGAYRVSNAYGFAIDQSFGGATTRAIQLSAMIGDGTWSLGGEVGNGVAGAVPGQPRIGLNGMQASLGYQVNGSVGVSTGWQHQIYNRDSGTFFNGGAKLSMDAVFLNLNLKTSE